MKKLFILFILFILLAVPAKAVESPWATTAMLDYWSNRIGVIHLENRAAGSSRLMICGDSITDSCPWSTINCASYINAGCGWMGVLDCEEWICDYELSTYPVLGSFYYKPSACILMIGTNDSYWELGGSPYYSNFSSGYQALLADFQAAGIPLCCCTILPVEAGYSDGSQSTPTNGAARNTIIQGYNTLIKEWCAAATPPIPVIDTYSIFVNSSTGYAQTGYTQDGIHPSAAGFAALKPLYDAAAAAF